MALAGADYPEDRFGRRRCSSPRAKRRRAAIIPDRQAPRPGCAQMRCPASAPPLCECAARATKGTCRWQNGIVRTAFRIGCDLGRTARSKKVQTSLRQSAGNLTHDRLCRTLALLLRLNPEMAPYTFFIPGQSWGT